MPRHKLKMLFIGGFGNPIASAWWYGLQHWCEATFIDTSGISPDPARLRQLALPPDATLHEAGRIFAGDVPAQVQMACGGKPDLIIGWWGKGIIGPLKQLHTALPESRICLIVDTWPDAASLPAELREIAFYNLAPWIDGFITYSDMMTRKMRQLIPGSRRKPYLALVEPFPLASYSNGGAPPLPLVRDDRPALIFTGRSDLLFRTEIRYRKDAVGPQLLEMVRRGMRVFVHEKARLDPALGIEPYPEFTNEELLDGTFSNFVSQFDGHLCIYNQFNSTIRRRVAAGLSTRLAQGLTAEAPIIATESSQFLRELWGDQPFGFLYRDVDDLARQLQDRHALASYRENLRQQRLKFSLQAREQSIQAFCTQIIGGKVASSGSATR